MKTEKKTTKIKPDVLALRGLLIISVMASVMVLVHLATKPETVVAYLNVWNLLAR